jgi:hypothetical protein
MVNGPDGVSICTRKAVLKFSVNVRLAAPGSGRVAAKLMAGPTSATVIWAEPEMGRVPETVATIEPFTGTAVALARMFLIWR